MMQLLQTPHPFLFSFPPKTLNPIRLSLLNPTTISNGLNPTSTATTVVSSSRKLSAPTSSPSTRLSWRTSAQKTKKPRTRPEPATGSSAGGPHGKRFSLPRPISRANPSTKAKKSPEAIEAFKMLRPSYRQKKMEEMGLTEDDWYKKQFEIKGNIPAPLETVWAGPLVVRHVPPRDWPPRGWEVDKEELEFIRWC